MRVLDDRRGRPPRWLELPVEPVFGDPFVDLVEQAAELEISECAHVAQRPGEQRHAVAHGCEPAHEANPHAPQGVEVERDLLRRPDELRRGNVAGPTEVIDLVVALVEDAGRVHPPQDVATAVRARHPDVLADGHCHRAARGRDLVSELQPLIQAVSGPGHEFSIHARKRLLVRAGLIPSAFVRRPTVVVREDAMATVLEAAEGLDLRLLARVMP